MQFFPFVSATQEISNAYVGHHIPLLVVLSLSMAILAALVSLLHTRLMSSARTAMRRNLWHLSGALSMGLGVWAMHFIGMVSFRIDTPVHLPMYYSPLITAISVLPAVFAAWVTLLVLGRNEHAWRAIIVGGVMMGSGIGAMHYTAMHATVFIPSDDEHSVVSGADTNLIVLVTLVVAAVIVLISAVVALMVHRQNKLENEAAFQGEQVKVLTERFESVAERVPGMVFQLQQNALGYLSFSYLSEMVRELFNTSVESAMTNAKHVLEHVPVEYRQKIFDDLKVSAQRIVRNNRVVVVGNCINVVLSRKLVSVLHLKSICARH